MKPYGKEDFDCVSEKLKFICEYLSALDICNPVSDDCEPILMGQVEHVLGYGEFVDKGFFTQFTDKKEDSTVFSKKSKER